LRAETDAVDRSMTAPLIALLAALRCTVRSRLELEAKVLALLVVDITPAKSGRAGQRWPSTSGIATASTDRKFRRRCGPWASKKS